MLEENIVWVILLLPLLAAVIISLFTLRRGLLSAQISITAVLLSFLASLIAFQIFGRSSGGQMEAWQWLSIGNLNVEIGFSLDPLCALMLLIVTGVGGAIHVYSWGYMKDDPSVGRFFAGLSLFTFSMLGIVMANNLLMMFIFWELVGVSSYLLIGFWYEKPAAADACKKAFITNRLGDFGFLLGILVIWGIMGTVKFDEIAGRLAKDPETLGLMSGAAGLLIFCGAMGKSAQFPLHVWLPDAMEGPTPVSALIHAATMVAAGVYMLCRVFFLFNVPTHWTNSFSFLSGITPLDIIAWIGGLTALLAALIAVQQNDIKRILAYSTLSQLGYMVMAVGLHGPTPAMFHLTTHAFFKALLFLAAGSVIYALHHEQDIWKMGALKKKLPITWITFLIGTLALCGLPPFSGFYSKDAILAQALEHSVFLFALAVGVAALTSFYMFRLLFVAFLGPVKDAHAEHVHESPKIMTFPLIVLAFFSVIAGVVGLEKILGKMPSMAMKAYPESFLATLTWPFHHSPWAAGFGLFATAAGFFIAWGLYGKAKSDPLPEKLGGIAAAMRNRFYFDEIYAGVIAHTHEAISQVMDWIDRWIISGLGVRGLHGTTELTGRALRLLQTGNLQTYAFLFAIGLVFLLWLKLGK
jgi:NADH-quinone oxidoreductase subunit L